MPRPHGERPQDERQSERLRDASTVEGLTLLVRELARGKGDAGEALLPHLVRELRAIAKGYLSTQQQGQSMQTSALVNEAYLKLFGGNRLEINDRVHFFALAAKAMRQVLVDHARRRARLKRGSGQDPVSISIQADRGDSGIDVDVLDLHSLLEKLGAIDARQADVVELRYFGGFEVNEVAEVLGVSKTTVEREWRAARAWLGTRLQEGA